MSLLDEGRIFGVVVLANRRRLELLDLRDHLSGHRIELGARFHFRLVVNHARFDLLAQNAERRQREFVLLMLGKWRTARAPRARGRARARDDWATGFGRRFSVTHSSILTRLGRSCYQAIMLAKEKLHALIMGSFPDAQVRIVDLTGTQDHYEVEIISKQFRALPMIRQHRMVYAALGEHMKGDIHALALKTHPPSE